MRLWPWVTIGTVLGLLGIGACIGSGPRAVKVSPVDVVSVSTREGRFPNGLRVIVETVATSDIAGAVLAVDAGSTRDPKGAEGLAHAVEHWVFRSRHDGRATVERRFNMLAAFHNGMTSYDSALYFGFVPKRAFSELLAVFSDIASAPLKDIPADDFERERDVVEAERGLRAGHAQGQIQAWLYDAIFPEAHPYARPVIGSRSSIAALTLEMAETFAQAHYRPSDMILYVVAPSELDAFERVSAVLGDQAGGPLVAAQFTREETPTQAVQLKEPGRLVTREGRLASPELWLAWPLAVTSLHDRARAKLLGEIARVAITPKFASHRDIARAECGLSEAVLTNVLLCRLVLNDAHNVDDAIDRALAQFREGFGLRAGFGDWMWELERDVAIDATLESESILQRPLRSAREMREYGNPFLDRQVINELAQVEPAEVGHAGFELADRKKAFAMLVVPLADAVPSPVEPPGSSTRRKQSIATSGPAPDPHEILHLISPSLGRDVKQFRLSNGLTVIAQRRKDTPFVSAILGFRGSSSWAENPALGKAVAFSENWAVPKSPSRLGLSMNRRESWDDRRFNARAVAPILDTVLEALSAERNPRVEWPNLRFRRMLPSLTRNEGDFEELPRRQERTALFGPHPYSAFAPVVQADAVAQQAIHGFFNKMRRPDNAALIVVANSDPDAVLAAAERRFGSWRAPSEEKITSPPPIDLSQPHPPTWIVSHRPASTETDLRFTCLLPSGSGRTRVAEHMLADVLRRIAEDELRGRTGMAYYASSTFSSLAAGADELSLSTTVANQHLPAALAFFKRIGDIDAARFPDFAWARFQWLEDYAFRDTTTFATANELYDLWVHDREIAELDREPGFIADMTLTEVLSFLPACHRHSVIVAVGDRSLIEAAR
jgi:zinc protease